MQGPYVLLISRTWPGGGLMGGHLASFFQLLTQPHHRRIASIVLSRLCSVFPCESTFTFISKAFLCICAAFACQTCEILPFAFFAYLLHSHLAASLLSKFRTRQRPGLPAGREGRRSQHGPRATSAQVCVGTWHRLPRTTSRLPCSPVPQTLLEMCRRGRGRRLSGGRGMALTDSHP